MVQASGSSSTMKSQQVFSLHQCGVGKKNGMLGVVEGFYRELFSNRTPVVKEYGKFFGGLVGGLNEEERKALEGPLTLREVSSAVASLKKGTAPGCDGLPAAFYEVFFP